MRLARFEALASRLLLVRVRMGLRPNLTPRAFASSRPLARAVAPQTTFELGEAAEHGKHRAAVRSGVARASGPDLLADDRRERVQQVARRARCGSSSPRPSAQPRWSSSGSRCSGDIASEGELGTVGVAVLFLANALTSASRRARVTIFGTIAC
jgi:hypothetical protein